MDYDVEYSKRKPKFTIPYCWVVSLVYIGLIGFILTVATYCDK